MGSRWRRQPGAPLIVTFNTIELSEAQGEPILLFDFAVGLAHFRYTTADRPITFSSALYSPAAIQRAAISQSSDIKRQTLKITAPRDISIATLYASTPPSAPVALTIWSAHYGDPDQQYIVDWMGRVIAPRWLGSMVELSCEPAYTSVQTLGLRRRWQRGCPHVLYGGACGAVKTSFRIATTLSAVSGFDITSIDFAGLPDGSYAGGYIEWTDANGITQQRSIDHHVGNTVTIAYGADEVIVGLSLFAYRGCKHTMNACDTDFSNLVNYGGTPYIPTINPFSGDPVY